MKPKIPWIAILAVATLVFSSLACSITVNLPETVHTTTTRTLDISEAAPTPGQTTNVRLEMGAGELEITGGAAQLIGGSIRYNVEEWQPSITRSATGIEIIQGGEGSLNLPDKDVVNDWRIQLGNSPINLEVEAGAYEGTLDLSGVPITGLRVSDGASKGTVKFASLNPAHMERLTYKTGASQVDLEGLGNANVSEIVFEGGAGSYTFDFSGELQQEIDMRLSAGMSNVRIYVPENASVQVVVGGGLNNVSLSGTWTTNGNSYERSGSGPKISIHIDMGVGNLELRTR